MGTHEERAAELERRGGQWSFSFDYARRRTEAFEHRASCCWSCVHLKDNFGLLASIVVFAKVWGVEALQVAYGNLN